MTITIASNNQDALQPLISVQSCSQFSMVNTSSNEVSHEVTKSTQEEI